MSNWPTNGNLTGKLSVGQGERGKSLEYMWRGTWLGIKREDEEEYHFVNLLPQGSGSGNNGTDGREIELQVNNGYIQWRYAGEETWNNLISLSTLEGKQGPKGDKGERGPQGEQGPKGETGLPGKDGATPDMSDFEDKINQQYEIIEKKIDEHIENHPQGGRGASIDDTIITKDKTWSSSKIEDFIHTNDGAIWNSSQGEAIAVDYTKEGYLREIEIWGNTVQNEDNLSDIQHLGELYVDSEGRKQYKIDVKSHNENLFDGELRNGWYSMQTGVYVYAANGNVCNKNKIQVSPNMIIYSNKESLMRICEYDKNNKFLKVSVDNGGGVTLTNNTKYINIYYNNNGNTDDTVIISYKKPKSYIPHKSYKATLLLPCRLMKVGNISDRLYWDSGKGKYVIEKKVDIPENYYKLIDETLVLQTPQLIETNITKEILLPSYKNKTHLFVAGGVDGSIRVKVPIDGGKAIQSLSAQNTALTLENEEIKAINKEQDELIDITMMATDQMYCLLEPLLSSMYAEGEAINPLVNMYVAMIKRGLLKTVDEVPERYRDLVQKNIESIR